MFVEQQKIIWNRNWERQIQVNPKEILNSRFTQEGYNCLKNFINAKRDRLILEAGCGTGRFCCLLARDFPDSQVIGMDISPNSLKIANRLKEYLHVQNVSFIMGNLFQMPYSDNYFDVVFNEGVIEHFSIDGQPNYVDAVYEMMRVTKRGGKVIVAVPNWYNFPHTLYKYFLKKLNKEFEYGYEKSFKHIELTRLFSELGLKDIEVGGFYPAHGFYRLSGKKRIGKIFTLLGKLTDIALLGPGNKVTNYFNKKFGFEIIIKGVKE